jgi:hypothetical protein
MREGLVDVRGVIPKALFEVRGHEDGGDSAETTRRGTDIVA